VFPVAGAASGSSECGSGVYGESSECVRSVLSQPEGFEEGALRSASECKPRIGVRRGCSLAVVMRVRCNAMHEGSVRTHAAIGGVQGCRAAARVVV
jgi:hypothetical protein